MLYAGLDLNETVMAGQLSDVTGHYSHRKYLGCASFMSHTQPWQRDDGAHTRWAACHQPSAVEERRRTVWMNCSNRVCLVSRGRDCCSGQEAPSGPA